MKQNWIGHAFFIICLLSAGPTIGAQDTKESGPDRERNGRSAAADSRKYVSDEVLVRFKPGASPADMGIAHAAVGAAVAKRFTIADKLHLVKLGPGVDVEQALRHYRQHPDVLYAEPNWIVQTVATPNDSRFGDLWGLHNIGQLGGTSDADIDAINAWDMSTGSSNVVVAVIDTGVDYTHPDLAANIYQNLPECSGTTPNFDDDNNGYKDDCYGYDFVNNDGNPMDDNNHGTHVSGTIGAVGDNEIGVVGVNWNVKIIACKFLNSGGSGDIGAAISCMDYVKKMKEKGVNIVATNNSWGGGGFSQSFLDAIEAHHLLGILFIAAAGNSNSNNDSGGFYPANYFAPNVIAVAATTRTDGKASFSSYGAHTVHVGAPGSEILSTTINNTYSTFNGTSMATPHVTGVAALIKAKNPGYDWKQIKHRILTGGDDVASMANITITGKRLNAYRSIDTCTTDRVRSRLRPILNAVIATVGTPVKLDFLDITCDAATPGSFSVAVSGGTSVNLTLVDGIYSGQWTPTGVGNYTLTFPNNDSVQVSVLQPYNYNVTSDTYRNIAGTNLNFGDDSTASVTPGFPIRFGGGSFNTVYISSNGNVNFSSAFPDYLNSDLTGATPPAIGTLVAPFWDDLYASGAQNVYWQLTGTSPNRELVIEWRDVRHYNCNADSTATVRFQVVFFEGKSDILFNYDDASFGGACAFADQGSSATIGIQVGSSSATQFSFNGTPNTLTNGFALLWTIGSPSPPPPQPPALSVTPLTPPAVDFGSVTVGSFADRTFTVKNTGGGTLSVTASIASPFSIESPPGQFNLEEESSQPVTVRFSPTTTSSVAGNVSFDSNVGSTSRSVAGSGILLPSLTVNSPSGGTWANNSTLTINWTSSGIGVTETLRIDLSRNGGNSWTTLYSGTPNDGSQTWKVKRPSTNQAKIRICRINAPSVCGYSGIFTIQ